MDVFHDVTGQILAFTALAAALMAALAAARWKRLSGIAGQLISFTHVLVAATGVAGLLLIPAPGAPDDPLHARIYGPAMVLVLGAAWTYRVADARRNLVIFAIACGLVGLLALRALVTG